MDKLVFDFSTVTAGEVAQYFDGTVRFQIREPLKILRKSIISGGDDLPDDLADLPFTKVKDIRMAFSADVRNTEGIADARWSFDVEMITGGDVEDFMQALVLDRYSAQMGVMAKYTTKQPEIRMTDLSFAQFLGVRSAFMEGIKNLGKN